MTFLPETDHAAASPLAKPEALLRVPMGFASPLWGLFATAAMGGTAWWWMTRWTRTENLEALFGAAMKAQTALAQAPRIVAAPILEAVDAAEAAETAILAVEDAVGDVVRDDVAEAETLTQAVADAAEPTPEPVGGEAAPISPVVAAAEITETAAEIPQVASEVAAEVAAEVVAEAAPKARKKAAVSKAD
jgi:hypothetical protein